MLLKSEITATYLSLSGEKLSGYGILSDEGIGSISIVYNTSSNLEEFIGDNQDEIKSLHCKWNTSDWDGSFDTTNLQTMNIMLFENMLLVDSDKFAKVKQLLIEAMLDTLVELKDEKLFNDRCENLILCFSLSDHSNLDNEIAWISKINSKYNSFEYIRYRNQTTTSSKSVHNSDVHITKITSSKLIENI